MFKVKLSLPNNASHLERQSPDFSCRWGDYQFFINDDLADCDAWVVCESLPSAILTASCPKDATILITGEPESVWRYDRSFVKQFAHVITCQQSLQGAGVHHTLQGHGWHLGLYQAHERGLGCAKNYDELSAMSTIPKTKLLSIICSNKQDSRGHRQRYEFALALKKALGDRADLFGRGIQSFQDKWDVMSPYKYSVAIENCANDDYITEKFYDCLLSHSFPFYHGAPNIKKYFSSDAYQVIDINDFSGSLDLIQKTINNPLHYDEHLPSLLAAKSKYLNHYNIFPLLVDFLTANKASLPKTQISLTGPKSGLSFANRLRIIKDKLNSFNTSINY